MSNLAYNKLFQSDGMTLGLMTPAARKPGQRADVVLELAVATRADRYGFAALWASQAPPQSATEGSHPILDDPFVWLAAIGAAAPGVALAAQLDLPRHGMTQWLAGACSLQRMSCGRCVLGVSGADHTEAARLRLEAALGDRGGEHVPVLHIDGHAARQPMVRPLLLELDERASAPAQASRQGFRGGRIALSGALERLAEAGVGHVLLHLVRNGRPVLDVIDELGTEVLPRLSVGVSS
ncbi:LLM class flavin-dependent oxidoreductase [Duganella levis]|uniref:LLM class flavin-dependent oxidoreductase n=1 Tax=Duganella levis TaxID=2692169 RepID=A0ABW9W593_9BURK|nr:LLM class flavin-dependent oxidoreductase [Duganella levis]MYN29148.1 LLM class flavin-dependent oxidoreductase [Duganella levis]